MDVVLSKEFSDSTTMSHGSENLESASLDEMRHFFLNLLKYCSVSPIKSLSKKSLTKNNDPCQSLYIIVPVLPSKASDSFSIEVIRHSLPDLLTNFMAASIFGPMLPLGNWPLSKYCFASVIEILSNLFSFSFPKF